MTQFDSRSNAPPDFKEPKTSVPLLVALSRTKGTGYRSRIEMDRAALTAVQESVPFSTPPTPEKFADQFSFDYNVFSSKNGNRSE